MFKFSCGIMKLKVIATSRVYQQLFILILLLQNTVSGQIDWAEDDDDPGMCCKASFEFVEKKIN